MSHTKTTTALPDKLRSPERDLPPTKLRSPSPPPHDSRAPSLAPPDSKSVPAAAARLTSPPPESASRDAPATDRPLARDASPDASDQSESDGEQENVIDLETFTQILDLDEDDTHDFSLGMAEAYYLQARSTFDDMDGAFKTKDLAKLSSLGHFLKGSSAALGVCAVQATCENIQHYGALRDEDKGVDLTEEAALTKIAPLLKRVKREYDIAERWLQNWYREHSVPAEV